MNRESNVNSMSSLFKYIVLRLAILVIAVCAVALLFSEEGHTDDYMTGMAGVFRSGEADLSEVKFINIGHRDYLGFGLSYQYEAGGWTDRAGHGREGSAYGAVQIGVEAGDQVIARAFLGPALITNRDVYLGGFFQFTEDVFLGLRGRNGNTVGVKYKHMSNAGIVQPNVGRDFTGIEAAISF